MHVGRIVSAAAIFATLTFGPIALFGTSLPVPADGGILAIGNVAGTLVGIAGSPFCINWGGGSTCAGATHPMAVSGASILFVFPSTGTIKDISASPTVGFLDVSGGAIVGGATIHFDLTSLLMNGPVSVGNCSNAPLNSCTPAGSPFTLSEDVMGTQVTIAFATLMNAYTGSSASGVTPYGAIFSTNQSGTLVGSGSCSGLTAKITNILGCLASGGTIRATWSATASPAVGGPLTITTTSVVNGAVGTPYSQTLTAMGGTTPYSWSIIGGRLPVGLNLNGTTGQITGTPTYAETSTVTFQVTDASTPAQTATVTLSFTIM